MTDVAPLAGLTLAVALDRPRQDHGRRAPVLDGGLVGRVDLVGVVTAQSHAPEIVVRHVRHQALQPLIDAPEVLPDVGAAGHGVLLVLPIHHLAHAADQEAVVILGEQGVPLGAPR